MRLGPWRFACAVLALTVLGVGALRAEPRNLADGFSGLPKGALLVVMPPDIELLSLSAGGVTEPRADWTEAAQQHVHSALSAKAAVLGLEVRRLAEDEADALAEVNTLQAAVARSIAIHHLGGLNHTLPTKEGKLDWSLDEAVLPIHAATGGDYALFIWMRDSYASAERKVAMVALALLGVGIPGGIQVGYASLVDLRSGQVLWFNQIARRTGDLREAEPAANVVSALLNNFPTTQ
ncbi:hypothetical protein [Accumulibacter sp.]|uniref:hypothetical protein n=1 Tax=Accumulibacter sp. TaxID=2053492 RepID=UPI002617C3CA|nr:hypothetical protein [Accumulibacter sp.]